FPLYCRPAGANGGSLFRRCPLGCPPTGKGMTGRRSGVAGLSEWVAVDWGTSNLRAWGIGADGAVVQALESDRGMSRLAREDYPEVLQGLLAQLQPARPGPVEVLVCGMAGARQGWHEAPYLEAPAALGGLLAA